MVVYAEPERVSLAGIAAKRCPFVVTKADLRARPGLSLHAKEERGDRNRLVRPEKAQGSVGVDATADLNTCHARVRWTGAARTDSPVGRKIHEVFVQIRVHRLAEELQLVRVVRRDELKGREPSMELLDSHADIDGDDVSDRALRRRRTEDKIVRHVAEDAVAGCATISRIARGREPPEKREGGDADA